MPSRMKTLKWSTVLIAQFILTQHMTHGRPLTMSTESDLHGDSTNPSEDVTGQLSTKQSFHSFIGDEESNQLTDNEEWSATPNYKPTPGFEKESPDLDFPDLPFDVAHPTSGLAIVSNSKEEVEEDLELYYESSTIDSGFTNQTPEPSEMLEAQVVRTGNGNEDDSAGTALDLPDTSPTIDDAINLPNESLENSHNVSEYRLSLDESDIGNDTVTITYSPKHAHIDNMSTTQTIQTTQELVTKIGTTPSYSSSTSIDQQLLNDTDLEDDVETQFTTSTAELIAENVTKYDSMMPSSVEPSHSFESPTTTSRLKEFTGLFSTSSTDILSSVEHNPELSTTESPFLVNNDYNDLSTASNLQTPSPTSLDDEVSTASASIDSIPQSSTIDYEVLEPTELYQSESNVSLESDLDDDNETISGSFSVQFKSLWNLISVEITTTVVIGAIAGGFAIVFISLLTICCLCRKKDSRDLNSPPTESSNCSSNSSASSFPAKSSS